MAATRATDGRYDYDDNRICICGHVSCEHRDADPGAPRRCDSPTDPSCTCPVFRPRFMRSAEEPS